VIIVIGVSVCIIALLVGVVVIALAFVIQDNDYLKTASDSQGQIFKQLNDALEVQGKYIAKLEAELRSKRGDA
jgi:hypothetical protein